MKMQIILATRNPSKAKQIKEIFEKTRFKIVTLEEAGIEGEAVEDGNSIFSNASKKALFAFEHAKSPTWTMADDTGIFIKALDGAPGVHSARWAGEEATTEEITAFTLKHLEGVQDRRADFMTSVCVISTAGVRHFFKGKVSGTILTSPRVPPQPKMPYSSIFVPDGYNQVWAEMPLELENKISHRGQAFREALHFIEEMSRPMKV